MVLVTGATGFVGSYIVCDLLRQGRKVRALRRLSSTLDEFHLICAVNQITSQELANLEWFNADILELGDLEASFQDITEVIHAAGLVSFSHSDRDLLLQVNVEGTANMVNLALHHKVQMFGFVSSIAAIGRSEQGALISEQGKWVSSEYNSYYAETKFAAEMEVWRGIQEGLNAVIVNPGVILGVCDFNRGTGKMFDTAYHGMRFYTPGINGFVDVRDVSQCLIKLMTNRIIGERFILVSENYPFRKFFEEASEILGKPKPIFNTPEWLAGLGWRMMALLASITGKKPLLTRETTGASFRQFLYNHQKVQSTLNFEFIPVRDTISWSCEWYLKVKDNKQSTTI